MTSIYLRVDGSCVTGTRLKHVYLTWIIFMWLLNKKLCVSVLSVCVVNFSTTWHFLLTLPSTTTDCSDYISWSSSQPLDPFTPYRSMCTGDSRHSWGAPWMYEWICRRTFPGAHNDWIEWNETRGKIERANLLALTAKYFEVLPVFQGAVIEWVPTCTAGY